MIKKYPYTGTSHLRQLKHVNGINKNNLSRCKNNFIFTTLWKILLRITIKFLWYFISHWLN